MATNTVINAMHKTQTFQSKMNQDSDLFVYAKRFMERLKPESWFKIKNIPPDIRLQAIYLIDGNEISNCRFIFNEDCTQIKKNTLKTNEIL